MHPVKQVMMENKLEVHKDKTLKEAVEMAYKVCLIAPLAFHYWYLRQQYLMYFPKFSFQSIAIEALAVTLIAHLSHISFKECSLYLFFGIYSVDFEKLCKYFIV